MTVNPIFVPILPDDSSCANLRNAHIVASNLWTFAACMFYQAELYPQFYEARKRAVQHALAGQFYGKIATLGWFLKNLESSGCR